MLREAEAYFNLRVKYEVDGVSRKAESLFQGPGAWGAMP